MKKDMIDFVSKFHNVVLGEMEANDGHNDNHFDLCFTCRLFWKCISQH